MRNQQNMEQYKANMVTNVSASVSSKQEKDLQLDPNNFQSSYNKFKSISD